MTRLFPLPLEGKGSADIESLPSYLLRLAHLHAVPVARLLNSLPYERQVNPANKLLSGSLGSAVRPNSTTHLIIDALSGVCSEDCSALRAATLLPLGAAMARSASSFAPHLRWCPFCLTEQTASSEIVYFKLVWQLSGVKACIHHRVRLRTSCPACGCLQRGWRRMVRLNVCEHCGAKLDEPAGETPDRPLEDCAPDLLHLVRETASTPTPDFPSGGSCKVVRTLIDSLKEAGACPDRLAHVDVLETSRYAGRRLMSLPMARRVAFQLSITLRELFSGDVAGINHVFGFCLLNRLPADLGPATRDHLAGEQKMYRSLIGLVERSESAPSLRGVARQLGVSVGALRYRFPRETEQIARAWQRRQVTVSNRRLGRVRNVVAECINQWGAQHRGPLTKKGLLRFLRATTDLPKEPLRRQIDFALTVLQARREISRRCLRQGIHEPRNGIRKQPQVLNAMNGLRPTFRAAGGMRNELNAPATSKELCSGHRQSTDAHGPGQTFRRAT